MAIRRRFQHREHIAVTTRRYRAQQLAYGTPEQRARFEADFPESNLPALPKKRGPRALRVGPSEHQVQTAVIQWWDLNCKRWDMPPFALFAVPNGGARDMITGARLKAEGVRRGVYDLILARPTPVYSGLFLEMKVGDGRPSTEQKAFGAYLLDNGYQASVHWTSDSASGAIEEYLGGVEVNGLSLLNKEVP